MENQIVGNVLRGQHQDIMEGVEKIRQFLKPNQDREGWEAARTALGELGRKLRVHLLQEEELLYPRLLGSADDATRITAQDFSRDMHPLNNRIHGMVLELKEQGDRSSPGQPNPSHAIMKGLVEALARRIEMEESILFPLLDAR